MLRKNEAKFAFCEINKKLLFAVILQNPFFVYCHRIRNDDQNQSMTILTRGPLPYCPYRRSVAVLSLPEVHCRSILTEGPLLFCPYRRSVAVLSEELEAVVGVLVVGVVGPAAVIRLLALLLLLTLLLLLGYGRNTMDFCFAKARIFPKLFTINFF